VFFNMNGKTLALRMDAEQKRIVALMALNTADARAELISAAHDFITRPSHGGRPMSNIDKRGLREAAEKATKGRWAVEFDDEVTPLTA
jgi:hypothetical protein